MIILIGASATGKTEVGKLLDSKYDIMKVVTYTTRPIRVGEVDGVDYHFLTKEEFIELKDNDFFFEWMEYNDNYYGTSRESLIFDSYLIVDFNGLKKYKASNIESTAFYFTCSKDIRLNRMLYRGDSLENAKKRIEVDDEAFTDEIKKYVDHVIDVSCTSLDDVTKTVYELYKK